MSEAYTCDEKTLAVEESIRQNSLCDSDNPEKIIEAILLLTTNDEECAVAMRDLNRGATLNNQEQFVLKGYIIRINRNLQERAQLVSKLTYLINVSKLTHLIKRKASE